MGSSLLAAGWDDLQLAEVTEDCWRRAGLRPGMRVLDVGCGDGASTFLAARLVGATGSALGADRNHEALRRARQRADEEWMANVEFHEHDCTADSLLGLAPFDAVVGRLYLVQQHDPALEVRKLARLTRPGGLLAFVEAELDYGFRLEPGLPARDEPVTWLQTAHREFGLQMNVVTSMPRLFLEAGLGWPQMRSYQATSPQSNLSETIREWLPQVTKTARRRAEEWEASQLAPLVATPVAGAWVRVR